MSGAGRVTVVRAVVGVVAGALAGCLDPLVSDEPGPSAELLPAGAEVPPISDDPARDAQLAAADGVDGLVPLRSAFAAGAPLRLWDFGPAPAFAAPLYVVVDPAGQRIDHPTIIDAMPGDPGYSPYWAVFLVEIAPAYQGERLTSFAAVGAAVGAGLVQAPRAVGAAVNCPAVHDDVTLDVGAGLPPLPPPTQFYYRGHTVPYYDFGPMPVVGSAAVPIVDRYELRREGGEPLSEPARGVDLTGDGDLADTNDVHTHGREPMRSPACRTVRVVIARTLGSIDTTGSDQLADVMDAAQLFAPAPVAGTVVAVSVTDELRNCAAQRAPGGL